MTEKMVAIVVLGVVLVAAIIGLTIAAVATDRDLFRAEEFTFAGVVVLASLAGVNVAAVRRWRVDDDEDKDD